MYNSRFLAPSRCAYYSIVLLALVLISRASCLEQDADVLKPVASVIKSIVSTVTTGSPSEIEFSGTQTMRNLMSLVWRTGFPATIPRTFLNDTREFYNKVIDRVSESRTRGLTRRSLSVLKMDLDRIIDSVMDAVRESPKGLYTDYRTITVNNVSLEDSLVDIGNQLKAYGVDLGNVRNIASVFLSLPFVPELTSTAAGVASLTPDLTAVRDLTSSLISTGTLIPGAALNSLSHLLRPQPPAPVMAY